DAGARPGAERQISAAPPACSILGQEPLRTEVFRLVPPARMAMSDVRKDQDLRSRWNVELTDHIIRYSRPREYPDRRIQAHSFFHNHAQVAQAREIFVPRRTAVKERELSRDLLNNFRTGRDQVEHPCQ